MATIWVHWVHLSFKRFTIENFLNNFSILELVVSLTSLEETIVLWNTVDSVTWTLRKHEPQVIPSGHAYHVSTNFSSIAEDFRKLEQACSPSGCLLSKFALDNSNSQFSKTNESRLSKIIDRKRMAVKHQRLFFSPHLVFWNTEFTVLTAAWRVRAPDRTYLAFCADVLRDRFSPTEEKRALRAQDLPGMARVSVGLERNKRDFRCFAKKGARAKKGKRGGGERKGKNIRAFPSPPPFPPLSFCFWLSPQFLSGQNTKNPVHRSFFAPKPHGNACYTG